MTLTAAAWLSRRASAADLNCLRPRISVHDELAKLCSDLRCAGPIGSACLRALPLTERSVENLAALIVVALPGNCDMSVSALLRSIREKSRSDFSISNIIEVDGWILSLTETRIYALVALLSPHRVS